MGAPGNKVTAIRNGCDTYSLDPAGPGAVDAPRTGETILYVGNVIESKGVIDLMAAFLDLAAARPEARLAVIGDGEAVGDLKAQAAAAGHADRVLMPGRRKSTEVAAWMRAADLLCLPSHSEGCPNAIVEALACGRPVVATNVGGIPELVDEECGILVPAHDPAGLRQALEAALKRQWDRAKIAAAHRRGWDVVALETYKVCCRVLSHE